MKLYFLRVADMHPGDIIVKTNRHGDYVPVVDYGPVREDRALPGVIVRHRDGTYHTFAALGIHRVLRPSHRADAPVDASPTMAKCECWSQVSCPRHRPFAYADCRAKHATDSL